MMTNAIPARRWPLVLPCLLILLTGVFCPPVVTAADGIMHDILNDQRNYFSNQRLLRHGLAFGIGGIFAHSSFDEDIQRHYQDRIRNQDTDDVSKTAKQFGEGKYLIPISLALAGLSAIDADSVLGEFGNKTARSYLAGAIPMLAMQRITGAGRPEEHRHGSKWRPLYDSNGVSGHAFIGAVPFLVAARMSNHTFIKYACYAASSATAFSRLNDNDHFASQIALGWYMAYESTGAVFETEKQKNIALSPMVGRDLYGLVVIATW